MQTETGNSEFFCVNVKNGTSNSIMASQNVNGPFHYCIGVTTMEIHLSGFLDV